MNVSRSRWSVGDPQRLAREVAVQADPRAVVPAGEPAGAPGPPGQRPEVQQAAADRPQRVRRGTPEPDAEPVQRHRGRRRRPGLDDPRLGRAQVLEQAEDDGVQPGGRVRQGDRARSAPPGRRTPRRGTRASSRRGRPASARRRAAPAGRARRRTSPGPRGRRRRGRSSPRGSPAPARPRCRRAGRRRTGRGRRATPRAARRRPSRPRGARARGGRRRPTGARPCPRAAGATGRGVVRVMPSGASTSAVTASSQVVPRVRATSSPSRPNPRLE